MLCYVKSLQSWQPNVNATRPRDEALEDGYGAYALRDMQTT